jgi:hypothetical protein
MISKELEEKIISKETRILAAQKRRDFAAVEAALAYGFLEIGGGGQLFTRTQVLDRLKFVHVLDYSLDRFRLVSVDPTCVVLTYIADGHKPLQRRRVLQSHLPQLDLGRAEWRMAGDFSSGDPIAA